MVDDNGGNELDPIIHQDFSFVLFQWEHVKVVRRHLPVSFLHIKNETNAELQLSSGGKTHQGVVEAKGAYVIGRDVAVSEGLRYLGHYPTFIWKTQGGGRSLMLLQQTSGFSYSFTQESKEFMQTGAQWEKHTSKSPRCMFLTQWRIPTKEISRRLKATAYDGRGLTEAQRVTAYANHPPQLPGGAGEEKISRKPRANQTADGIIPLVSDLRF